MDKQEFSKVIVAIKAAYPNCNTFQDKASLDIWYMMLNDIPYAVAQPAVLEIISSNKFPPSIAEIREKCTSYTTLPTKDYGEAWESVHRAIRKFGYMQELEALESLDEVTRRCVKMLGYQNLCVSANVAADRSNFREIYKLQADKKEQFEKLPMNLQSQKKSMLEQLTENIAIEMQGNIDKQPIIESSENKTCNMERVNELMKDLKGEPV